MSNFVGKRPNPLAAAIQGAAKLFGKNKKQLAEKLLIKLNQEQNLKVLRNIKKISLELEVRYRKNFNL